MNLLKVDKRVCCSNKPSSSTHYGHFVVHWWLAFGDRAKIGSAGVSHANWAGRVGRFKIYRQNRRSLVVRLKGEASRFDLCCGRMQRNYWRKAVRFKRSCVSSVTSFIFSVGSPTKARVERPRTNCCDIFGDTHHFFNIVQPLEESHQNHQKIAWIFYHSFYFLLVNKMLVEANKFMKPYYCTVQQQ